MLAIEIDGHSHIKKENYDQGRDLYLEQRGIKTIRYKNDDIINNIGKVRHNLLEIITKRKEELML